MRIYAKKVNRMFVIPKDYYICGKSYLLFNLFCQYLKKEGIAEDHIIKVDLDGRSPLPSVTAY